MMALAQLVASIRAPFNAQTSVFAAAVAAWFTAHPDIIVQAVDWNRPDSTFDANEQVLRVAYLQATSPSIGSTWEARFYQTANGVTAQEAFNADFAVGSAPSTLPVFVLDITDHERGKTGPDSLLVICVRTDVAPLGLVGWDRAAFIAQPIADILAGATGDCILIDGSGRIVSLSLPVKNVSASTWAQHERNYAVYDEDTGVYMGLAPCSGAGGGAWVPPAATTTTAFPCPTVVDDASPTTPPPAVA